MKKQYCLWIFTFVRNELLKDKSLLLPLRWFIGLGWIRASVEKIVAPGWTDGAAPTAFLENHLHGGSIPFPFYDFLITEAFLPHATVLGLIILVGEVFAGLGIITGTFSNLALLGGLFMNVNFILAGEPNPSAFYIVIQSALLITNAGAVLGFDRYLSRIIPYSLIVAQPQSEDEYKGKSNFVLFAPILGCFAIYALFFVEDFSPGGSVHDPAMVLVVLALMGAITALIISSRLHEYQAQAMYDRLTGVLSKSAITELVKAEISRSQRMGSSMSLAMIEIDDFKSISDQHGKETSDKAYGRSPNPFFIVYELTTSWVPGKRLHFCLFCLAPRCKRVHW